MCVKIRRAKLQDVPSLAALCDLHAAYERSATCGPALSQRLSRTLFGPARRAIAWVALPTDARIVGFATASPVFSTWQGEDFLHLDCLFVTEAARGRGTGRALVDAVRRYAASHGYGWLEWQTPAWNTRAIRFYEALGATARPKQRFELGASCTRDRLPPS